MLKTELKIETVGSPHIMDLPESDSELFFRKILNRILQLVGEK